MLSLSKHVALFRDRARPSTSSGCCSVYSGLERGHSGREAIGACAAKRCLALGGCRLLSAAQLGLDEERLHSQPLDQRLHLAVAGGALKALCGGEDVRQQLNVAYGDD